MIPSTQVEPNAVDGGIEQRGDFWPGFPGEELEPEWWASKPELSTETSRTIPSLCVRCICQSIPAACIGFERKFCFCGAVHVGLTPVGEFCTPGSV